MTTREIEVPKIPENTTDIVDEVLNTYCHKVEKLDWLKKFLTEKFGFMSEEYNYFFNCENDEKIAINLVALEEYEVIKEHKYVIKLPIIDDDGTHHYLNKHDGEWDTSYVKLSATRFTMDEIKNNPNLKGLEQYAVEVEDD